ncbi:response regulator transcription factor [Pseudocolwellia sp. AS88]|uniref:response regulator transcription factor n=1 Tax=Pseudocolwellia sp. AS88 TaxID=3063958 RepID=UPI0026EE4244|nr:response regulator transcription factor [Pseudocolwellia sp. AS88]MDO7083355.1 response regulator transcription factor [Pseudocolwellia sp. AS88]
MQRPKILVIDDESKIRDFISISLSAEGFEFIGANNAKLGLQQFASEKPNLIVLDLGLPDIDGREVLKKVREVSHIPVLVLTARDQDSEKVRLLGAGANDYLSKPFSIKELIARIKVLLRDIKYEPIAEELYFSDLTIRTSEPCVFIHEHQVHLTKKEHQLLVRLASTPDALVNQKRLLADIWGPSHEQDTHYLRVLVTQLRKKLNDNADDPLYINTEPGVGYRFIASPLKNHTDD